ncbi:MAG: hypothetical protein LBU39_02960 [Desulfobulbaceae bacterium]|jgi:hypothetical protein|nr:hypothetical protein [Desulfobulbaceae bacterium]
MEFLRGPQLFSFARKKAAQLGVGYQRGVSLAELISRIQQAEGHQPCFKERKSCDQKHCCWQASCGAKSDGSGKK